MHGVLEVGGPLAGPPGIDGGGDRPRSGPHPLPPPHKAPQGIARRKLDGAPEMQRTKKWNERPQGRQRNYA